MIRIVVYLVKFVIATFTALLFSSCMNTVNGNGKVITQNRTVEGEFTKISISGGLQAEITQSSSTKISVETDDNLQEHIKTEVSGKTLKVYTDDPIQASSGAVVKISLPTIESLSAKGGTTVYGKTLIQGDKMTFETSGGSSMEVQVKANKLDCESSSGSHLIISGVAESTDAESSSGSTLDASGLKTQKADADASSGSNITIDVLYDLDAEASSGASINYMSTPAKLQTDVSSGGSVNQK